MGIPYFLQLLLQAEVVGLIQDLLKIQQARAVVVAAVAPDIQGHPLVDLEILHLHLQAKETMVDLEIQHHPMLVVVVAVQAQQVVTLAALVEAVQVATEQPPA